MVTQGNLRNGNGTKFCRHSFPTQWLEPLHISVHLPATREFVNALGQTAIDASLNSKLLYDGNSSHTYYWLPPTQAAYAHAVRTRTLTADARTEPRAQIVDTWPADRRAVMHYFLGMAELEVHLLYDARADDLAIQEPFSRSI